MRGYSKLMWAYILTVIAAGFASLIYLRVPFSWPVWKGLFFFTALTLLAEAMPVRLPRGEAGVSIGFVFIFASLIIYGPNVSTWVATIGTISLREVMGKISLEKTLFNRAQLAICGAASGLVYVYGGGVPGTLVLPGTIPALAASAFVYMFLNVTLMVVVMAMAQKLSPVGMWLVNFRWLVPNYLALAPLGVLLARVYLYIGEFGVILFFLPLMLARHSFQRFIDMRDVYLSTVQALAAAIDAKDPYTRGHSDRVTKYAVATARRMKLPEDQVEILQYVALLHDMGKIGIKDSILNKPGKLLEDEFAEIKKHPVIGAGIASEIKFLSKGAETVRHHHEWYNGSGYPDGLRGEDIPLGARILAVVDAYDAMTTDRPYRKALAQEEAVAELKRGSGTQFDPQIAEEFIAVLQSGNLPH